MIHFPPDVIRHIVINHLHWNSVVPFLSSCQRFRGAFTDDQRFILYRRSVLRRVFFNWCYKTYMKHFAPPSQIEMRPPAPQLPFGVFMLLPNVGNDDDWSEVAPKVESPKVEPPPKKLSTMFLDIMEGSTYRTASDNMRNHYRSPSSYLPGMMGGNLGYSDADNPGCRYVIRPHNETLFGRLIMPDLSGTMQIEKLSLWEWTRMEVWAEMLTAFRFEGHGDDHPRQHGFCPDDCLFSILEQSTKIRRQITAECPNLCGSKPYLWNMLEHLKTCDEEIIVCGGCDGQGKRIIFREQRHFQQACWCWSKELRNKQCGWCEKVTLKQCNWNEETFDSHVIGCCDQKACPFCLVEMTPQHNVEKCGMYRLNCRGCGKLFRRNEFHPFNACASKEKTKSLETADTTSLHAKKQAEFKMKYTYL